MTMNFFALVNEGQSSTVKRLRVNQSLQTTLATLFAGQGEEFLDSNLERVPFDSNYTVDDSELFIISDYVMNDDIIEEIKHPTRPDELSLETSPLTIKSIFAGEYDSSTDQVRMYFQSFNKSRLLVGGMTLLHSQNTFKKLKDPALTLDSKLVAAYVDGDLLFRSYRTVNSIIDIVEYFKEATNEDLVEFLNHDLLAVDDADIVLEVADSWMRKRFSAILASGILDQVGPKKISKKARRFGIAFATRMVNNQNKLIFPTNKPDMKKLLTFLNEGYFEGELTGRLFQTNSQRVIQLPSSS